MEKIAQVQAKMVKALMKTLALGEAPVTVSMAKASMTVAKHRPSGLANSSVETTFGKVLLPSNFTMVGQDDSALRLEVNIPTSNS